MKHTLFFLIFISFVLGCRPHSAPKLYNWPTGPIVYLGSHQITLPASIIQIGPDGIAYIDTVIKDRIIDAIDVQIKAFEADEQLALPSVCLGVTDQQEFLWLGDFVAGGWEVVDNLRFWNYAINTIGENQNVWPVYHELHHIIYDDRFHQSPKWSVWNARGMQLGKLNAARPYPTK